MFIVFVLCVNLLVAVVGDSYDFAMLRARKLFLRTKLQLIAEFEALGLTTMPPFGNGLLLDKCFLPLMIFVFGNPRRCRSRCKCLRCSRITRLSK